MADGPVFLERASYRGRRLMDVVRLLPLLVLALWMIPLIWPFPEAAQDDGAAQNGIATSTALKYLFGVWIAMVVAGWLLWRRTRQTDVTPAPQDPQP